MNQVAVNMPTVSWRQRCPPSHPSYPSHLSHPSHPSSSAAASVPAGLTLKSDADFPSLGSKHVAINVLPPPINLPKLDFKGTVEKMIASASAATVVTVAPKKAAIPKKTPAISVYDRIEYEDNLHDYELEEMMEEGREFNASIFTDRRRGDKGVW
jgi:hypothetical protein